MNDGLPFVSIIIAARPDESQVHSARASRNLDYPTDRLEVLVARGRQPSVQRNAAAQQAAGEILYFLDDDSIPHPANLRRVVGHFRAPGVVMAGGPNLCPPDAPALERSFAQVMASRLAFGPSRARYFPVGVTRPSNEKELILCNLAVRREVFLNAGGFDESLYPNEENAMMDALLKAGGTLIYDPELLVHRRPRPSLAAFWKMLLNYGRGRAEQFRLHPTPGSALNFVPPLFCVYLAALPFLPAWGWFPLALYAGALALEAALLRRDTREFAGRAIPLIVLTHVAYGLGFWKGLFTRLGAGRRPRAPEVRIERVALS